MRKNLLRAPRLAGYPHKHLVPPPWGPPVLGHPLAFTPFPSSQSRGPCPDILLSATPQITRVSTTVLGATTTSSRKGPRPHRPKHQWTYLLCRLRGRPGRLWEAWNTLCPVIIRPATRSGSPISWRTPQGTHPAPSPACLGLCTPCRQRSSGPARPSPHCRLTAGRATETICLTPLK